MKVERLTYANYLIIDLEQYSIVHGIIEGYGARVKDFQQDKNGNWIMFYGDMRKDLEIEFLKEMQEYGIVVIQGLRRK